MTTRLKNALWFAIPALTTAAALTAITLASGGLEQAEQEVGSNDLTEPVIALVLFAIVGGTIVGGAFYLVRRLRSASEFVDQSPGLIPLV